MPTQHQVETMVKAHVLAPATKLVAGMVDLTSHNEDIITLFEHIFHKPDYTTPAYEMGIEVECRPDGFHYISELGGTCYEGPYNTAAEVWKAACEHHGIEPYYNEAYEHWIVSDWLAAQLEKHGELIERDFYGLNIWGRCDTGQAIYIDGVMSEIYVAVGKRLGE